MELLKLFSSNFNIEFKVNKALEILNLCSIKKEDKETVLNEVAEYIFDISKKNKGERVFDFFHDFKYYYADFYKLGIDLNKDMGYWEFDVLLNSILMDEKSTIAKVIKYRCYEKPKGNVKTQHDEEHRRNMKLKQAYSLPSEKSADEALAKLWDYASKGVEKNE